MTQYTDAQIRWAARLLSVAFGRRTHEDCVVVYGEQAGRLLAELERQGVKATTVATGTPEGPYAPKSALGEQASLWRSAHDAAPICPEGDQ